MYKTCSFLLYNILHHLLFKAKGHKELVGFLFNDFLLLATPLSSATSNSLFDSKTKAQYKMYKSVSTHKTEFCGVPDKVVLFYTQTKRCTHKMTYNEKVL